MPDETSPLLRSETATNNSSYVEDGANTPDTQSEETQTESRKSYLTFIIPMSIGIFLSALDATIVVSSYAAIGSELNQLQSTSWIATSYMLTTTTFQPFVVSIIMSDVIPLRLRGTWQGIINIIWTIGSAAGAPLGGFLVDSIGWRWAFLIQVPIAISAFVAVSFALHLPKLENSDFYAKLKRVDFAGSLTLIVTIFALLFGLDRGGNVSWSDPQTRVALGSSLVFFIIFGLIEFRVASEPFAPKHIIFNQSLIAAYLVNFFGVTAALSQIFYVSLYLQAVQGKSASAAGLWLVLAVGGGMIGSLGGGLTIQATGKFYLITVGSYALQFLGSSVVSVSTGVLVHSVILIGAGLFVSSVGNGSGVTTTLIALIANAGQADQAVATAVSYLFRSLGAVVGVSVGSTIVQETLRTYLRKHLTGLDIEEIILHVRESLSYLDKLDPATLVVVREGYAQAVQVTLAFSVAMSACAFVSSAFIKEKALAK
ncbi:hypothetical protein DXG03_004017 [Asterophora parasitica]|uniref:Major facilitator superfamily (MFS) profile domain-containing protein n=1 Tax=Asterophora parasitica TaxID=117018 RepID=A0A9P7G7H2_9AGAR|nr:hypothetical protein DXG03_004017 [Asterophora parasitica]